MQGEFSGCIALRTWVLLDVLLVDTTNLLEAT